MNYGSGNLNFSNISGACGSFANMLAPLSVDPSISRDELYTLARRNNYLRFMNFPVELSKSFDEIIKESGR